MSKAEVLRGAQLVDVDRFVATTAGLYKKNGNRERGASVAARIRDYAENVLPGLMIDRRDPIVLATQNDR